MNKIKPLGIEINVIDYEQHTTDFNGFKIWDNAFVEAFNQLNDGDTFIIPEGIYYIRVRSVLANKSNITIECRGTIMPVNGETALIGAITLNDLSNVTINNLTMNGNRDNLPPTTTTGYQSLIEINDCQNIEFNNLYIYNTMESGLNSNGNIDNIVFNSPKFENIGEHCIYFGATDVKNIYINDLYCKNIGMSPINDGRHVAVVKLRNKKAGDIKHKNIYIENFTFISDTNKGGDRQFVQAFDTESIYITTGIIKGEDTSIFGGNTAIEEMIINNIHFEGRRLCYNFNDKTGYNTPTDIVDHGAKEITIINSNIKGATDYLTDVMTYSHCKIDFNGKQFKDSLATNVGRSCIFDNCEINVGSARIDICKATNCDFEFNNVEFIGYTDDYVQPMILNKTDNNTFSFDNVKVEKNTSVLVSTEKPADLKVKDSYINACIKSDANKGGSFNTIDIKNTSLKVYNISNYATFETLTTNGVYDINGNRKDNVIKTVTIKSGQVEGTASFKYDCVAPVKESDLVISYNREVEFATTINDSIVTLELASAQNEDVTFTIEYKQK